MVCNNARFCACDCSDLSIIPVKPNNVIADDGAGNLLSLDKYTRASIVPRSINGVVENADILPPAVDTATATVRYVEVNAAKAHLRDHIVRLV